MARTDPQINIRMPAKLKESIEAAAVENNRSATSEIVARLEQSMLGPKHPPNIIVRLEALPYGSEVQEISLGTFFENFSRTVRGSVADLKQARRLAGRADRASDSLSANLDVSDEDQEVAEQASAEVRVSIREKRIREAENLARKREQRQADTKPDKPDV